MTYNVDRASVFKAIMDDKGVLRARRRSQRQQCRQRFMEPAGGRRGDWIVVAGRQVEGSGRLEADGS